MIPNPARTRPTLLVVEDEPNHRELYQLELGDLGYEVRLAGDGREASRMIDAETPDLVVLDLSMPGTDGADLLGRLLHRERRIPVVVNTSYSRYRSSEASAGADAFVVKSADLTELEQKIAEVLRRNRRPLPPSPPFTAGSPARFKWPAL